MASKFTENYELNQWERSDKVLMEDFNADNAKIDAALKAVEGKMPQVAASWFWGDGNQSQFISTGFTPKAVLVYTNASTASSQNTIHGGLAVIGQPVEIVYNSKIYYGIRIADNGFHIFENTSVTPVIHCNTQSVAYSYIAIA